MNTYSDVILPQSLPGKQVLVVIGMHRSGTSASTGALQCVGVQLGKKLYSGHGDVNAKGYFEHSDIADTNDEVMLRLGSSWDDVLIKEEAWWKREELIPFATKIRGYIRRDFSNSLLWAVKDPRVCRLLPWWLDIFAEEGISPHFIFVVRSPDDVYRSLKRRDGFSQEKSSMLWLLHYLEAEAGSRGHPRVFTSFDRFLEDPCGELLRMERQLKLRFPVSVEAATDCLNEFLSKDLRHHTGGGSQTNAPVVQLSCQLNVRLQQAAVTDVDDVNTDDIMQQVVAIQDGLDPMLVEHLRLIGKQRGQVELTIHRLMRSLSWLTGKPVRFMERMFGRDV